MEISIKQSLNETTTRSIDTHTTWLVILPKKAAENRWPKFPYAELLRKRHAATGNTKTMDTLVTDLPNANSTRVVLAFIDTNTTAFNRLSAARKAVAAALVRNPGKIAVTAAGFVDTDQEIIVEAVVAAILAANGELPSYKSKPEKPKRLNSIELFGLVHKLNLRRTEAEAEGNNLARYLTALPPNNLTPGHYRKRITALARANGWRMEIFDLKRLRGKKAGAFLAVAQGSATPDACIIRLRYTGSARAPRIALVGKGICFDTGGMNLKPAKSMYGMHEDMEGSAVALGTLLALTRLKAKYSIDCWLALAQNHIGPKAYKQNDVVTACNGTTIEIVHTDAEGRMVLADTLALAAREKPHLMLDYATLTGSCIYALGTRYCGAFSNRESLNDVVLEAGAASGERVWPFPMSEDFDKALDSRIADIKQCTLDGEADHILGARFLGRFVDDVPWVHIDLAAGNNKGGLAHVPSDITGFGVRFSVNLLLDQQPLAELAK